MVRATLDEHGRPIAHLTRDVVLYPWLRAVVLAAPDGTPLPKWEPGAHIDVALGEGLVRQYSLCSTPGHPTWRLGVLEETDGRGGSHHVHHTLREGDLLRVSPRNNFPLRVSQRPLVLVAGPIDLAQALDGCGGAQADVYACGPSGLLAALEGYAAERAGCTLRLERAVAGGSPAIRSDDQPLVVELSDGTEVEVRALTISTTARVAKASNTRCLAPA